MDECSLSTSGELAPESFRSLFGSHAAFHINLSSALLGIAATDFSASAVNGAPIVPETLPGRASGKFFKRGVAKVSQSHGSPSTRRHSSSVSFASGSAALLGGAALEV